MDLLQKWSGNFFDLDTVSRFIKVVPEEKEHDKRVHELFITWIFAKFLSYLHKKIFWIGLPTYTEPESTSLNDYVFKERLIDEEFDTILIDKDEPEHPIYFQIKRFRDDRSVNTKRLFDYIVSKVKLYGKDEKLNIIFDIQAPLIALNFKEFKVYLENSSFDVGGIFIFWRKGDPPEQIPFIMSVYPIFDGIPWVPGGS
ncbi:MAG: hypothetical protein JXA92_11950 [candidate division Zixibacteria bacterium]|nr:hypothetical protein [candidate division Zixibacteria bacterium]